MDNTTLGSVLQTHHRFHIPNYQRDYAWGSEQFDDLWEDLEESVEIAKESGKQGDGHFLGTIVIAPHGSNGSDNEYDLIDGQQRMTTIFMLLTALIERSVDKDELKPQYLIKGGKLRFQVIEANQAVFNSLLEKVGVSDSNEIDKIEATTQGQKNLREVFKAIVIKVRGLGENDINTYIDTLLKMKMLVLKENSAGQAIRTFQSVNDRGVQLNILDKLKSLLIYYSNRYCKGGENGLDDEINGCFRDIFRESQAIMDHKYSSAIGGTSFKDGDMVRYHIGSASFIAKAEKPHYRDSTETSYDKIKKELKARAASDSADLKEFLRAYAKDLAEFFTATVRILDRIGTDEKMFECMFLENLNSLLYPTFIRLEMLGELSGDMIEFLAKVDCALLKFNGAEATAYGLREELFDSTKDIKDRIESLKQRAIRSCRSGNVNIDGHISSFVRDSFAYKRIFHYLFFKQYCHNATMATFESLIVKKELSLEIEHILPQALKDSANGFVQYGFDSKEDFDRYCDQYGNLLSLEKTLNSGANNGDLTNKKSHYGRSAIDYVKTFNTDGFDKNHIKGRAAEAEKFFKEEFFKDFIG